MKFSYMVLTITVQCLLIYGCAPKEPLALYSPDRFAKLDKKGNELSLQQGPWHCIHDRQTQLIWEVKQRNETASYMESTYSWFDGRKGVVDGGSCGDDHHGLPFVRYQPCDTFDLIRHLNEQHWCGFSDWRLPQADELRSLLFESSYPGAVKWPTALFPHAAYGPYWTADLNTEQQAMTIHIGTRETYWARLNEVAYMVAVRGP